MNVDQHQIEIVSQHIDVEYYIEQIEDKNIKGIDNNNCVAHFCEIGWKTALDPNRWFSVNEYLSENTDVRSAGVNPFYHYLVAGKTEGRKISPNSKWQASQLHILKSLKTLDDEAQSWLKEDVIPLGLMTLASLENEIRSHSSEAKSYDNKPESIISISHDNFLESAGGVQLCIAREMKEFAERGNLYFHIFPYQAAPRLNSNGIVSSFWGFSCNGIFLGYCRAADITSVASSILHTKTIIIHSLIGHSEIRLLSLIKRSRCGEVLYWVHDYFSFCESWTLTRNKLSFCGAPSIDSVSCFHCYYGKSRPEHVTRIRNFLKLARPQLVFPSSDVHDRYKKISQSLSFPDLISHIVPHIDFKVTDSCVRNHQLPIRVAFIGHPSLHKGWSEFVRLFKNEKLGHSVQFYHFASKQSYIKYGLRFIEVNTVKNGQDAMVQAITESGIDFALIWPQWPETFGLTAIEALVGGCRIITNISSGAIYSNLRDTGFLHAYTDFDEAEKFIINCANTAADDLQHPIRVNYGFSSLSAAIV